MGHTGFFQQISDVLSNLSETTLGKKARNVLEGEDLHREGGIFDRFQEREGQLAQNLEERGEQIQSTMVAGTESLAGTAVAAAGAIEESFRHNILSRNAPGGAASSRGPSSAGTCGKSDHTMNASS